MQSLREHPSHAAAIAGLRASVLALVELEIRQKHADTAEALLREVDRPDPALLARLAEIRRGDETRQKEAQRLEAIDHDLDPTVAAAPRAVLVGLLVVLTATITGVAVTSGGAITPLKIVVFGGIFATAVLLGSFLFRKRLMTNAFNRRLSRLMIGVSLLVEAERVVGYFADVPVSRLFATDLWISAMAVGTAAITLRSRLWLGAAPCLLGAILATSFPERAANIFSLSIATSFLLLGVALRPLRSKRSGP